MQVNKGHKFGSRIVRGVSSNNFKKSLDSKLGDKLVRVTKNDQPCSVFLLPFDILTTAEHFIEHTSTNGKKGFALSCGRYNPTDDTESSDMNDCICCKLLPHKRINGVQYHYYIPVSHNDEVRILKASASLYKALVDKCEEDEDNSSKELLITRVEVEGNLMWRINVLDDVVEIDLDENDDPKLLDLLTLDTQEDCEATLKRVGIYDGE